MAKFIHLVVLFLCGVVGHAHAGFISTGTIYETENKSTTVDRWYFTLPETGTVTADILAKNVDINGDGNVTQLNAMLYLFKDDGLLDNSDVLSFNSHYTYDNQSKPLDPYLSADLSAGDYILMISDANNDSSFSIDEAIAGFNDNNKISKFNYGDYQISWSDNVLINNPSITQFTPAFRTASFSSFNVSALTSVTSSSIPISEPSALAILGVALFLIGLYRIGRHKPEKRQRVKSILWSKQQPLPCV